MFVACKSDGETPPKPTLDGAIAFWASKDPLEEYAWSRADICACGQYAKSIGDKTWIARDRRTLVLWNRLNATAAEYPRTFGALVERVKSDKEYALF